MSYQPNPYTPQDSYAQQQQLAKADHYEQPGAYPLHAKPVYPPAQPGYPPSMQPPVAPPSAPRPGLKVRNPWASSALYSGIISLILGSITLFSLIGFAHVMRNEMRLVFQTRATKSEGDQSFTSARMLA